MKTRKLIIVLMVAAIVMSLSAGTLAIYTTTIESAATTTVKAKEFVIDAGVSDSTSLDIKLAPADVRMNNRGDEIYFTVSNFKGDTVSEVPLKVTFDLMASGDIFNVPGIDIKIINDEDPLADEKEGRGERSWLYGYMTGGNGKLSRVYTADDKGNQGIRQAAVTFPAGVKTTKTYRIRYQWLNDDRFNDRHTAAGIAQMTGSLQLNVAATQLVTR